MCNYANNSFVGVQATAEMEKEEDYQYFSGLDARSIWNFSGSVFVYFSFLPSFLTIPTVDTFFIGQIVSLCPHLHNKEKGRDLPA